MKKVILFCLSSVFFVSSVVHAESRTANGLSDVEKLAITAGAAQACGANTDKLQTYEMIASRIIVNPLRSEAEENAALKVYAQKKLQTFQEQKSSPELNCQEVLARFNQMSLFKSTLYRDGTLKLPDGKVIKPMRPLKNKKGK